MTMKHDGNAQSVKTSKINLKGASRYIIYQNLTYTWSDPISHLLYIVRHILKFQSHNILRELELGNAYRKQVECGLILADGTKLPDATM